MCVYVCINSWFLSPGENTTIDFEFNSAIDIQDNRRYLFSQLTEINKHCVGEISSSLALTQVA